MFSRVLCDEGLKLEPWKLWGPALGDLWKHHWALLIGMLLVLLVAAGIAQGETSKRKKRARRIRAQVAFAAAGREEPSGRAAPGDYEAAVGLLTPAEAAFLPVLRAAVRADHPDGPRVLAKVRLADIASPPKDSPTWLADFNRVASKHVDFVICAGDRMLPMRVVELDDSSHERADRRGRDELVDLVLKRAGIPITHVRWQRSYRVEEVRGMLV